MSEEVVDTCLQLGFTPLNSELLTTFAEHRLGRRTHRVTTNANCVVKVRCLSEEWRVERLCRMRASTDGVRLSPMLARSGRVMVEDWIHGKPLDDFPEDDDVLRKAASLLAQLHSCRVDDSSPGSGISSEVVQQRMDWLRQGGILEQSLLRALELVFENPSAWRGPRGLVHGDFCGENLVQDVNGEVWSVDNENLDLDFLDYDLGLSWYRWPLSPEQWGRFLNYYERSSQRTVSDLDFWKAVAVVKGLYFHSTLSAKGIEFPKRRLTALLAEGTL